MSHQVIDAPTVRMPAPARRRPAPPRPASIQAPRDVAVATEREVDVLAAAITILGAVAVIMLGLTAIVAVCRLLIQLFPTDGSLLAGGVYVLLPTLVLAIIGVVAIRTR